MTAGGAVFAGNAMPDGLPAVDWSAILSVRTEGDRAMIPLHPEFVVDEKENRKAVIVPYDEWRRLMDELEELDDIRAYDRAKAEPDEAIPFEDAVRDLEPGTAE
jgi:hypothetical protein